MRKLILLLSLLLLTGCSEKFDGSTVETARASVKSMRESFGDIEQQKKFHAAVTIIVMQESFKKTFSGEGKDDNPYAFIHGLTANEIIDEAQARVDRMKVKAKEMAQEKKKEQQK